MNTLKWSEEQLAAYKALRRGSASLPVKVVERAKYRNKKTTIDGMKFDSKAEGKRYLELRQLEAAKLITGLKRQVPYLLVVNGNLICKYLADFVYRDCDGKQVVEDVKGMERNTRDYVIKRKLMLACHGITVIEFRRNKCTR